MLVLTVKTPSIRLLHWSDLFCWVRPIFSQIAVVQFSLDAKYSYCWCESVSVGFLSGALFGLEWQEVSPRPRADLCVRPGFMLLMLGCMGTFPGCSFCRFFWWRSRRRRPSSSHHDDSRAARQNTNKQDSTSASARNVYMCFLVEETETEINHRKKKRVTQKWSPHFIIIIILLLLY